MLLVTAASLPPLPLPSSPSALPSSTYLTRPRHASTPILGAANNSYQLNIRILRRTKPIPLSNLLRVERCFEVFEYPLYFSVDAPQVEKEPGNKQEILEDSFTNYE